MIRIIAIVLLILNGISALFGGIELTLDPSGERLGASVEWLQHSPFKDFLIPGLILLVVNGIGSLVAAALSIYRIKGYPIFITIIGFGLTIWIIVQVLMIRKTDTLQLIYGSIGLALIALGGMEWRRRGESLVNGGG